jgi:hypothetical protein
MGPLSSHRLSSDLRNGDGGGRSSPNSFMPFSNGTEVTVAGEVRVNVLTVPHVVQPNELYINGTLHSDTGLMCVTAAAPLGAGDVFINGILHTFNGVRYVLLSAGPIMWPEGFSCSVAGLFSVVSGAQAFFIRGISRSVNGEMGVEIVP